MQQVDEIIQESGAEINEQEFLDMMLIIRTELEEKDLIFLGLKNPITLTANK